MFDNFGVVMKSIFLTIGCAVAIATAPVFAQSSGQSVSVRIGVIDKAEAVTLQNTGTALIQISIIATGR